MNVKKSGHKNTKSTHSLKQMRTYKFISGIGLQRPLPNCAYLSNSSWVFTFWWRHPAILSRFRAGALRLVLGCLAKINILLMMKGTLWCVGVCDFWHCLSWPYFHISAYLCTFSVFLHFPTLLYLCISVTVLQICVGVCTIMLIAATWCRRLIATTSNWFALQITASPLFAFLLCFVNIYFFSLQITALPSFSTSSPNAFQ